MPHIIIASRKGRKLKTKHSKRVIPLVGYALQAFQARPEGFPKYRMDPDHLTNKVNKFLREHDLFPSEKHSVYSLRHSFQDRLSEVDAPDRIQAELMGHRFSREKYGHGPSLEKKKEWMEKICLKEKQFKSQKLEEVNKKYWYNNLIFKAIRHIWKCRKKTVTLPLRYACKLLLWIIDYLSLGKKATVCMRTVSCLFLSKYLKISFILFP